ncbi:MAG: hypothetical protein R2939_09505 [Kofleriaceae bacterium]
MRAGQEVCAALVAVAAIAGCGKSESASSATKVEPAPAGSGSTAIKPTADGPFAAWDMAARRAAWQGAHVTPGSSLGSKRAIDVRGDQVTVWDGKTEKAMTLDITSPCEARFVEVGADGSRSSTTSHYTLKDGALLTGLGDAGTRRGKEAVACVSNVVVTLDANGTCTQWKAAAFGDGRYEASPGTCAWVDDGGQELLSVTVRDHETRLLVDGDALLTQQLQRTHSQAAADFAAAKALRDGGG